MTYPDEAGVDLFTYVYTLMSESFSFSRNFVLCFDSKETIIILLLLQYLHQSAAEASIFVAEKSRYVNLDKI